MKWTPGHGASVFMHPSGYLGSAPYGGPETGSNGMTLDPQGRLTVAGHAQRNVWRLESLSPYATRTILADKYEGKRLNSPNDLVYGPHGALYFTDPPYGLRTQSDQDPHKELKVNGVYRILDAVSHRAGAPPDESKLQLLISNLTRPTASRSRRIKNTSMSTTPSPKTLDAISRQARMARSLMERCFTMPLRTRRRDRQME